ncbi:hypothetical protein PPERSA_02945 [Pseudocohnilembus persalinus]|uniref:Saposin B-type domain-containing protein n=1 Tax=Pseudocohnilembus persalinus TaxID=266149 RepID=A0A0V0QA58_PSEPJ|nr:hypothetical protein PPERSA_02945 [Pseudocohnilembus persalinus]|eukprot:KRW99113.1 hypothetical protein PPERSA_02945 [Pseudocohnilembus persalinus]
MKALLFLIVLIVSAQAGIKIEGNVFQCLNEVVNTAKNVIGLNQQLEAGVDKGVEYVQIQQIISDISPLFKTCKFKFTIPKKADECILNNIYEFQPVMHHFENQNYYQILQEFTPILEKIFNICNTQEIQDDLENLNMPNCVVNVIEDCKINNIIDTNQAQACQQQLPYGNCRDSLSQSNCQYIQQQCQYD